MIVTLIFFNKNSYYYCLNIKQIFLLDSGKIFKCILENPILNHNFINTWQNTHGIISKQENKRKERKRNGIPLLYVGSSSLLWLFLWINIPMGKM